MKSFFCSIVIMFTFFSSSQSQSIYTSFEKVPSPDAPQYSNIGSWASHPSKEDMGDKIPRPLRKQNTKLADSVDVFFVHPTIFTGDAKNEYAWNADILDSEMNKQVDKSTIKLQASIFNQAGRLFAPRYRQAHLRSFFKPNEEEGLKALALAYEDVKAAFLYYLENENNGRPIIFAGHSQGARHIKSLLKELVDGKALQKQLVAAYIVGWGVDKDYFEQIPLGNNAEQTGCFLSWRTYNKGYTPKWIKKTEVCVNPINWKTDSTYASYEENRGAVLYGFNTLRRRLFDAKVAGPVLWVGRPKIIFGKLLQRNDYHIGDYNLFYANVQYNAIQRARSFLAKR